jgi:glutathione S-transferase
LPYRVFAVKIGKGEQFRPAFLADEYSIADIATVPWVARGMAVPTPPQ